MARLHPPQVDQAMDRGRGNAALPQKMTAAESPRLQFISIMARFKNSPVESLSSAARR
jgi:hypothetical protein